MPTASISIGATAAIERARCSSIGWMQGAWFPIPVSASPPGQSPPPLRRSQRSKLIVELSAGLPSKLRRKQFGYMVASLMVQRTVEGKVL